MEELLVVDPVIEEIKIPAANDPLIDSRCERTGKKLTQEFLSRSSPQSAVNLWAVYTNISKKNKKKG